MPNPYSTRRDFAAQLRLALEGVDVDVLASPRADAPVTRPRVILAVTSVDNAGVACPYARVLLDVTVVTPKVDPDGPADDALDNLLGDVLAALDTIPGTSWTTAVRGVWQEILPAYRIETERS